MFNPQGVQVPVTEKILDLFHAHEGEINFYYGRIGGGKTYAATADILGLLERGHVVYCNWRINFDGFDQRKSLGNLFFRTLFGVSRFYNFPAGNLRYIDTEELDFNKLESLTDCHIFIDEGQWIFDSYEGTQATKQKRRFILHTRHVNRTINIISQRPTAIHVTARANVNRWYRCDVKMRWPLLIFRRTEFQDMSSDTVDETADPISTKVYFASKKVFNAYNTRYLRGEMKDSQQLLLEVYKLSLGAKIAAMITLLFKRKV